MPSVGIEFLAVVPCYMSFFWPAILEPTVENTALLISAVPFISTALILVDFTLIKHTLQLVSILHVYSASSVFYVALPLPLVPLLGLKRKV